MRIYILEDNFLHREYLKNAIEHILLQRKLDYELDVVLEYITFNDRIDNLPISDNDIFFIDIDLKINITGIDIAKSIRRANSLCFIIFVTNNTFKALEIINYQIKPFHYLIKENNSHINLDEDLENLFSKLERAAHLKESSSIKIDLNSGPIFLIPEQVNYVNSVKRDRFSCTLHKTNGISLLSISIGQLKKQLTDKIFFNDFRQYIINTQNIEMIYRSSGDIIFRNGETLNLSPRMIDKLLAYLRED